MGLTLVTGRANSGKTGVLHAALRDALASGEPVTLLLPTMPDVRRTEAELGRDGLVGARVAVLDGWIDELWTLYGDGRRAVTPGVRHVLLSRAVSEAGLELLAASAEGPGLVSLLADIVQRLTRVPGGGGQGVEAEVARVLRRYDELCDAAGFIERAIAARRLAEQPPPVGGPVLVNRFTDLSEAQEALLRGLATRTGVVVALTWEPDLPTTAALDPLIERMFGSAEVVPLTVPYEDSELGRLEERLYCPGEPIAPEGMLDVGLAAGDEAECALAARFARQLVDSGIEPDRVAIVFRDAGRRLGLLTAALASEGVDADLDVAVPLARTPLGAAFAALIAASAAPSRERLLALLLSPYSDADAGAAGDLDVRWRRYRVTGDRLLRDAAGLGPATARALGAAGRAARGLDALTVRDWREAADALLAAASRTHAPGSAERALDASAHRALLSAIDDVVALPGARLRATEVLDLLARTKAPLGAAERPGAVQVTEAHRLRSRRFDAVVLGGLTAEEFSAERPEPLSAELASRLGAAPGMQEREAERMLFYLVATRARRKLVLLRQESDARGEAKRPSVFWDEVVDLYVDPEGTVEESLQVPPGIEPRRLGLADLASAAPTYAPGRREQRTQAQGAGFARVRRGSLSDPSVLEALAATTEFSVTELETYAACPYRWFYDRAVRPRELDVEVDARERGSLAHRLLAAFYAALPERLGSRRVSPAVLEEALALFDEVASAVEGAADTKPIGLREELAVAQARAWARGIVTDDADLLPAFEPVEHEFGFGEAAGRPFRLAGVALRGSVDRIDAGPAGLVITDYKSDAKPSGWESFGRKPLIQLPVYAAAARELLSDPVAAGLYRSLRSLAARGFRLAGVEVGERGSAKDEVSDEAIDGILAEAAETVVAAAEGIRAGRIGAAPVSKGACVWCGARVFCEGGR